MKKKRTFLARLFYKISKRIIRQNIGIISRELLKYGSEIQSNKNERLISQLQASGGLIKFNGRVVITDPQSVILGINVHIGDNTYISSAGGLIIGDNTHISRNVTIYTVNHNYHGELLPYDELEIPKPVYIGKNVWIGMNVSIIPGIRIGDGAIIGLGTVVTHDVKPCEIIGSQPQRILKNRDIIHYRKLESKKKYAGSNGQDLRIPNININRHKIIHHDHLCFILSTGRSGTKSIAESLTEHPEAIILHEPHLQLIRLSSELAHGEKINQEVSLELHDIFNNVYIDKYKVYGESDQKYFNLVHHLCEIFPAAKFIWLIRNAKDFIASAYGRDWYSDDEKNKGSPTGIIRERFDYYRLNGGKCTDYDLDVDWDSLNQFEKICWYWSYINSRIEKQLMLLPPSKWMQMKIEDLEQNYEDIFTFLGLKSFKLTSKHSNKGDYKKYESSLWRLDEIISYKKICLPIMKKLYPDIK